MSCAGLGFHLLSSALKLMIRGPEDQQIQPSARHNGAAELPVDVFEERSSFFSVSTSLPPHTDAFTTQAREWRPLSCREWGSSRALCDRSAPCFSFVFFTRQRCVESVRMAWCALRAKACRWMRSSFTKSSNKCHRSLQVQLTIIPQTQTKLDLRSGSLEAAHKN